MHFAVNLETNIHCISVGDGCFAKIDIKKGSRIGIYNGTTESLEEYLSHPNDCTIKLPGDKLYLNCKLQADSGECLISKANSPTNLGLLGRKRYNLKPNAKLCYSYNKVMNKFCW